MTTSDATGTTLAELPGTARIWIFGADRPLNESERRDMAAEMAAFVGTWTAHGARVRAGAGWIEDRFLIVAADETAVQASGCSIDALVRRIGELGQRIGCNLLDGTQVYYRDDSGRIAGCGRADFRALAAGGAIAADTPVFDLSLETLAEVRNGGVERPLSDSWHRRLVEGPPTRS